MEQPDGAVVRQTDVVGHFERGEDAGVQVVVAVRVEVKQREVLPDGGRMLRGVLRLAELPAERPSGGVLLWIFGSDGGMPSKVPCQNDQLWNESNDSFVRDR